ncbi:MAG: dihydroorotase [Candidatus Methylacidiphilales bacterium]
MELLILNATICFPASPFFNKVCDVLIVGNQIDTIALSSKKTFANYTKNKKNWITDAKNAWLMPSMVCLRSHSSDPGNEHKESLTSLSEAAIAGGFSTVCVLPDSDPTINNKSAVEYVINKSKQLSAQLLPYGTLSQKLEGKELSEMYDMHLAGAVGFTDANYAVKNSGLMLRALQYSQIFGGKIFTHAEDVHLSTGGRMHEGNISVLLGLKGIPAMAEEMAIKRDLELAKYANAPIHFSHISSKGAVEIIQKAKKQGIEVTCDVAVANLIFTDNDMLEYNANLKLNPPLRSKEDKKALWAGLMDGTIDAIVTDHFPQNVELKDVEFEYADEGMIMLQTALPLVLANAPKGFEINHVVEKLCINPRNIINLPIPELEKGSFFDFIIFDPNEKWILNDQTNKSKSRNTVFYNKEIKGKVLSSYHADKNYNN